MSEQEREKHRPQFTIDFEDTEDSIIDDATFENAGKHLNSGDEIETSDEGDAEKPAGWTLYLVYSVLVAVLGAPYMYGYNSSVVNAPYEVMSHFVNESFYETQNIVLTEEGLNIQWSLVVSLFVVGGIIGSVWFPERAANLFGR